MVHDTDKTIRDAVQRIFPGREITLHELPDERSWSRVYLVRAEPGVRAYVKGTPRTIPEAQVTVRLAAARPDLVPLVLHPDLLPESDWCWFAMEDAGDCARLELAPEEACRAAFALGVLQRTVQRDAFLESILPSCLPEQLQQIILESFAWLMRKGDAGIRAQAQSLYTDILHLTPVFESLTPHLMQLPPTCVHGDFWPGNIAMRPTSLRIIDWGEAIWGIGGASVWNLLLSSQATLMHAAPAVWDAHSQGWQHSIEQEYIDAAQVTFYVTMLVVGWRYTNLGHIEIMRGMLVTLENALRCLQRLR